jgi:hypothetical protein
MRRRTVSEHVVADDDFLGVGGSIVQVGEGDAQWIQLRDVVTSTLYNNEYMRRRRRIGECRQVEW